MKMHDANEEKRCGMISKAAGCAILYRKWLCKTDKACPAAVLGQAVRGRL